MDALEGEGRVVRVRLQECEILVGKLSDMVWKSIVAGPEATAREVIQSRRIPPARSSVRASFASVSSLPFSASCSI